MLFMCNLTPEGNRLLGRPRSRWEDIRGGDVIQLAKDTDKLTGSCEYGNEPWDSIKRF
jgi:hypothetical protein